MTQTHCSPTSAAFCVIRFIIRTLVRNVIPHVHAQSHWIFFLCLLSKSSSPPSLNWICLIRLMSVVNSVPLLLIVICNQKYCFRVCLGDAKKRVYREEGVGLSAPRLREKWGRERDVDTGGEKFSSQITLLMNAIQFAIRNSQHSNQSVWPTNSHWRQWKLYNSRSSTTTNNNNSSSIPVQRDRKKWKSGEPFRKWSNKNFCFRCVDARCYRCAAWMHRNRYNVPYNGLKKVWGSATAEHRRHHHLWRVYRYSQANNQIFIFTFRFDEDEDVDVDKRSATDVTIVAGSCTMTQKTCRMRNASNNNNNNGNRREKSQFYAKWRKKGKE